MVPMPGICKNVFLSINFSYYCQLAGELGSSIKMDFIKTNWKKEQ
jgi:hypothetical protein